MNYPLEPLAIIPAFVRNESEAELLRLCLESMHKTAPGLPALVVDDGSPERALTEQVVSLAYAAEMDVQLHPPKDNEGFSRTVNRGLQAALDEGRDAILVNQDIEFIPGWLQAMQGQDGLETPLPAVVGALLAYPIGLIQHAGVYLSLLDRQFHHRFYRGPMNLPEAQVPAVCPVTAALMYIRHKALVNVGLFDEDFRMAFEDVDYCLRVFMDGGECVYCPTARAFHHESVIRGQPDPKIQKWTMDSFHRLTEKYQGVDLAQFVPEI